MGGKALQLIMTPLALVRVGGKGRPAVISMLGEAHKSVMASPSLVLVKIRAVTGMRINA